MSRSRLHAAFVALLIAGTLPLFLTSPARADEPQLGVLAANVQPTWQTNGPVWAMARVGGTIFVAGDFTAVRPPRATPGTNEVVRRHVAAFNASTGELLPFAHRFDIRPRSITGSPDGSRVYFGGGFTEVNGKPHAHLAAFNANTGKLLDWAPTTNGTVSALSTSTDGKVLYLGGDFTMVNDQWRIHLAAVNTDTAAVTPWAPIADAVPTAMAIAPAGHTVYVTGYFSTINGDSSARAIGAINSATGELRPFPAAAAMPPVTPWCRAVAKDVVAVNGAVYVAAEGTGEGCFDGTFAASISTGELLWKNTCLGATQTVEVVRGWLYKGAHTHDCASQNPYGDPDAFPEVDSGGARHLLAQRLDNGFLGGWYPNTNGGPDAGLGPRAMATDGTRLWVGGQFTTVNGKLQQGIARFAPTPETTRPGATPTPTADRQHDGSIRVVTQAAHDIDDPDVIVRLYRDNEPRPVARSKVVHSLFWHHPSVAIVDSNPPPGSHRYRVDTIEAKEGAAGPMSDSSEPVRGQIPVRRGLS